VDGFAIGGLLSGETPAERVTLLTASLLPIASTGKLRLLAGSSNPFDVLDAVSLGVDLFDGYYAKDVSLQARVLVFGSGRKPYSLAATDASWDVDMSPIVAGCECLCCSRYSRAYVCHLLKAKEMLGETLMYAHNLHHMRGFFAQIREAIKQGTFDAFKTAFEQQYTRDQAQAQLPA
jgi:tRNA-guanine family transglycosylase